ncbi:restriction endonuclease subunit S [Patescibacteria group bacterium]|nr:MAG: restriction endonuclease subunit S [Patescibacteria group bacterium]
MKKGWQTKRLADVCEIIMGQSPDGESYNTTGEGVPLINGPVEFSDESFGNTIRSKFTTQPTKFCKEGDLILCVRGSTTGRMNIAGFDACVGRGVAAIRAKQYQPWINHFISSKRDEIHGKGTGATFPNVSGTTLADFEMVVPPLPEQRRIVGILDEAFEGIATVKANAEKNLQNARALFESHLQSVFTQRGKGWVKKPLGDLCDVLDNQRKPITKRDRVPGDIPYYGANGIQDYVDGFIFDEPLVLVGEDGAKWGAEERTAFAVSGKCWVNNHAHVLRPNRSILLDHWLIFFLNSSDLNECVSGLTVPKLNQGSLREIPIPVPPLPVQKELTENARELDSETQRLASLYERKLAVLEALKKSLLHQAFTGQL